MFEMWLVWTQNQSWRWSKHTYERVQRLTNIFVRTCWKKYLAYNGFEIQSFYAINKSRISLSLVSCITLLVFSIKSYLKQAFSFKIWPKLAQIWLKEIRHLMFKCKILPFILFDDPLFYTLLHVYAFNIKMS